MHQVATVTPLALAFSGLLVYWASGLLVFSERPRSSVDARSLHLWQILKLFTGFNKIEDTLRSGRLVDIHLVSLHHDPGFLGHVTRRLDRGVTFVSS